MPTVPQSGPLFTARPEDYILCTMTRDGDGIVTAYLFEDQLRPRLTLPGGTLVYPPRRFPLAAVSGADLVEKIVSLTEVVCTRAASSETIKVWQGARNGHVHRLRATVDGFVDVPTLDFFDGFMACERFMEHFALPDEFAHNPTLQGGFSEGVTLDLSVPGVVSIPDIEKFRCSPAYYAVRNPGADGAGYVEGAAPPLTFQAYDLGEGPQYNHGGNALRVAIFWDQPQYEKFIANFGNRARLHKITHGFFQRRAWVGTERPPQIFFITHGASLLEQPIANVYDTVEFIDVDNPSNVTDVSVYFAGIRNDHTRTAEINLENGLLVVGDSHDGTLHFEANPIPGNRVCIALTDSATGFCTALIAKLTAGYNGCRYPIKMFLQAPLLTAFGTQPGAELGGSWNIQIQSFDPSGRVAGWVVQSYFKFIGDRANLDAALNTVAADGLLDAAEPDLPAGARVGTEWPPGTDPGTITVDAFEDSFFAEGLRRPSMSTLLNGVTEGAVAPGCGTGVRTHKALLRSTQTLIVNARPVGGAASAAVTAYTTLTVASGRMNPPSTLVAHIAQTSAATGTLKLRVRGFDQFGEKIVEETPVISIVNKTNNYIYLSKVFAFVTTVEFQSTGLDFADDTLSLGTRWDWTRTVDANNAHTGGLNLGWGLPLRLATKANVAVSNRHKRATKPDPVAAWATVTLISNPNDAETLVVNGKTYTFKATIAATDGHVLIGATLLETLTNLYLAINLLGTAGVNYGSATTIHSTVKVLAAPTVDTIVLTAKTPGVLGNLYTLTTTMTVGGYTLSAATFEGGESDTGEVLRINVRDVSGRSSSAARPPVTAVDGRRILIGYGESGWGPSEEKASILKQDAADQWGGTAAIGDLTIQTNPGNGHTVTIDSKVYTFETSLTNVDGNVLIGASAAASLENLRRAINLMSGAGTNYAAATTLHSTVFAYPVRPGTGLSGVLRVQAKTIGTAANSIGTTEALTGTGNAWGGATLAGGATTLVDIMVEAHIRTAALPFQS